jgi:two-component system, response regulator PdtaR
MAEANQITILVVDDEWLIRSDLAQSLEDAGYHTREASNAAEAITMLENHREIRVVFTDIQMPGTMDGVALSHVIRKRWPPTILIISSGNPRPQASDLPGETEFLAKPTNKRSLGTILQNLERRLAAI